MAAASDRFRGQPINVLLPKRERSGRSEPSCWVKMRKHFLLVCPDGAPDAEDYRTVRGRYESSCQVDYCTVPYGTAVPLSAIGIAEVWAGSARRVCYSRVATESVNLIMNRNPFHMMNLDPRAQRRLGDWLGFLPTRIAALLPHHAGACSLSLCRCSFSAPP